MQTLCRFIAAGLLCVFTTAAAAGEHADRVGAELAVLAGDLQRYQQPETEAMHRQGLAARIAGGLAGLEILMRLADQEANRPSRDYASHMADLRTAWHQGNAAEVLATVGRLRSLHPFSASRILGIKPSEAGLVRAKELHDELCAGCHDAPDLEVPRPAYNLFVEARRLPSAEFAARMIVGVRGDRITGIGNPLSAIEIAAMIAYYRSTPQAAQTD